jgi:hypothetical protein
MPWGRGLSVMGLEAQFWPVQGGLNYFGRFSFSVSDFRLGEFPEIFAFGVLRFRDFAIFYFSIFAKKFCRRTRSRRATWRRAPAHINLRRGSFPVVDGLSSQSPRTAR